MSTHNTLTMDVSERKSKKISGCGDKNNGSDIPESNLSSKLSEGKSKRKEVALKAVEMMADKWGKDAFSENDFQIERGFLHKLYDTCEWNQTQLRASNLLPSLVQVVAVETLHKHELVGDSAGLNRLGICDGQHIFGKTQRFDSKMPLVSVLTKSDVSNYSVIRIESAFIGDWSRDVDREIIQELTDDQVDQLKVTSSDIYEADFKSSVMHNLVIVLKKVSVVAHGSMIGHLFWERKLLRGSPEETEAATQRWFKKANELMEVKSSECSNNSLLIVFHIYSRSRQLPIPVWERVTSSPEGSDAKQRGVDRSFLR